MVLENLHKTITRKVGLATQEYVIVTKCAMNAFQGDVKVTLC